jgi:YD repeat-containing protein
VEGKGGRDDFCHPRKLNGETTFDYDLRGLPVGTTNPVGAKVTTLYDPAQRPVGVMNPLGKVTSFEYDSLGNRLSATTPLGIETSAEYDDARLLPTKTTDGEGNPVTSTYDLDGRQVSMTTARRGTYLTDYDNLHRTISTSTPAGRTADEKRNTRGLVEETVRPSGRIVRNTSFDAEGRVLTRQILAPNGTLLTSGTMSYDTAGRLRTVSENGKTTTRAYDTLERLATYSDGEGNTITYGYDLANNLTSLTYPGSKTVTYAYDSCNRLSIVTDWNGRRIAYEYDLAGRLVKTTRHFNNTIREQKPTTSPAACA